MAAKSSPMRCSRANDRLAVHSGAAVVTAGQVAQTLP